MDHETEMEQAAETESERFIRGILEKLNDGEAISSGEAAYLTGLYAGTHNEVLGLRSEIARLRSLISLMKGSDATVEDGK